MKKVGSGGGRWGDVYKELIEVIVEMKKKVGEGEGEGAWSGGQGGCVQRIN